MTAGGKAPRLRSGKALRLQSRTREPSYNEYLRKINLLSYVVTEDELECNGEENKYAVDYEFDESHLEFLTPSSKVLLHCPIDCIDHVMFLKNWVPCSSVTKMRDSAMSKLYRVFENVVDNTGIRNFIDEDVAEYSYNGKIKHGQVDSFDGNIGLLRVKWVHGKNYFVEKMGDRELVMGMMYHVMYSLFGRWWDKAQKLGYVSIEEFAVLKERTLKVFVKGYDKLIQKVGAQYFQGRVVARYFVNKENDKVQLYSGKVASFCTKSKYVLIAYEDGDQEEVNVDELSFLLAMDDLRIVDHIGYGYKSLEWSKVEGEWKQVEWP